jgi:hypothetical protein
MGIKQIIPTKKFEDIGTSIFAIGQGRYDMLTVPSSFIPVCATSAAKMNGNCWWTDKPTS